MKKFVVVFAALAGAADLTEFTIKLALEGALAVERMFILREGLGEGLGADLTSRISVNDVSALAKITFEAVSGGRTFNETETAYLSQRFEKIKNSEMHWMQLAVSRDYEDEESLLYTGRGRLFTPLFNYIYERLPNEAKKKVSLTELSMNLLTKERIDKYLAESLGNDLMFAFLSSRVEPGAGYFWVPKNHKAYGEVPPEYEAEVMVKAREWTRLLALVTYKRLKNKGLSKEDENLVIFQILKMADSNVVFTTTIRGMNFVFNRRSYVSATGEVSRLSLVVEKYTSPKLQAFFSQMRSAIDRAMSNEEI